MSTAYVLLGGRHAGGEHPPHPTASPSPPPFLIRKSSRYVDITSTAVTNVHGIKWMAELKSMCNAAESKLMHNGKELVRPKEPDDTDTQNRPRLHEGDLYLCAESLAAFEGALGGVLDAVDTVFAPQGPCRAFTCVRPPGHHCSDDYPSGFCWLNNVHVGISHAALEHGLTHAAIFDFDLHHGDGSQSIVWAHNARAMSLPKNAAPAKKTSIGYFSLHDINSYPCEWGEEDKVRNASLCIENAHGQNIWNVHLQPWKTEAEFWKLYEERYSVLIEKMRAFLQTQYQKFRSTSLYVPPKGAIFISAGFDASEWEGQGMQRHKVNVPTTFYSRVTRDIVKLSQEEGLGVDGRVISVLEGGYSDRALASGVLSHICGLSSVPSAEMASEICTTSRSLPTKYDDSWWSASKLEELERNGNPAPSPALSKKNKTDTASSYHTPTQSFVAKVVSAPTYQRSVANSISQHSMASKALARSPTPPPPDVDWVTASHELSQIIIPQDRQTKSCQAEELNAKATEARKIRQSILSGSPLPAEETLAAKLEKVTLRDRRAKTPQTSKDEPRSDSSMAAGRRKTFGGMEALQKEASKQSNRRLSVASTTLSSVDDSFVKSSTPPIETPPVAKSRAAPKTRAPRKAVTKPPVSKAPAITKAITSPTAGIANNSTNMNSDGAMEDLVSSMKNVRIKLNVPSKAEYDRKEAAKSVPSKDIKKPNRAPRKPAMKKTSSTGLISDNKLETPNHPPSTPLATTTTNQPQPTTSILPPPPLPTSSSTPQQHPHPPIDNLLFNQAPLDPTLADYLAPHTNSEAPWSIPLPHSPAEPSTPRTITTTTPHQQQPNIQTSAPNQTPSATGYTTTTTTTLQSPAQLNALPVFTSSTPIPFAAPSMINPSGGQTVENLLTNKPETRPPQQANREVASERDSMAGTRGANNASIKEEDEA